MILCQLKEQALLTHNFDHVAGRNDHVVAFGAGLQLRQEILVADVEVLSDFLPELLLKCFNVVRVDVRLPVVQVDGSLQFGTE